MVVEDGTIEVLSYSKSAGIFAEDCLRVDFVWLFAKIKIMSKLKREKILHYYAIFEPIRNGGFNVSFPSFPGCATFGRNFEEAKEKAKEVLELWLEELKAQKQEIPSYADHPIVYEIPIVDFAKR